MHKTFLSETASEEWQFYSQTLIGRKHSLNFDIKETPCITDVIIFATGLRTVQQIVLSKVLYLAVYIKKICNYIKKWPYHECVQICLELNPLPSNNKKIFIEAK